MFDIPLLYETRAQEGLDAVLVVSAPAEAQAARVMARPGMTREKLDAILARQVRVAAPTLWQQLRGRVLCGTCAEQLMLSAKRCSPLESMCAWRSVTSQACVHAQVPDAEKRARADFVIDTGCSKEETERRVVEVIQQLAARRGTAAARLLGGGSGGGAAGGAA